MIKKSSWTCDFEKCYKLHEISLYYGGNGLVILIVFFGTPLTFEFKVGEGNIRNVDESIRNAKVTMQRIFETQIKISQH